MPAFPKPRFPYEYDLEAEVRALRAHKRTRRVPRRGAGRLLVATWNVANFGLQQRRDQDRRLIAEMVSWFEGARDHGDAEIGRAQDWLDRHFQVANPVDERIKRSKLAERTFKRRFTSATGLPPLAYVQRLRVEQAKRRLERTDASIEQISWQVGYDDPAFFRRLFRRTTGLAPGVYRRRFQIPDFARQ